ncbi:MAG: 5-deoxy-glucuronate isomerase [Vicinamibacterales bacterium]
MKLIKADHDRRIAIHGVQGLVSRPVDIDQSVTGFRDLRSLRIYRFDQGSVIDGDAEQDEVLVVVLAGSIEFAVNGTQPDHFELSAAGVLPTRACVAYLPPRHTYRLRSHTVSEVAYARATPQVSREPRAFAPGLTAASPGVTVVIDEHAHAERLRLRLLQLDTRAGQRDVPLFEGWAQAGELIVHARTEPADGVATAISSDGAAVPLLSWDSCALTRAERPFLRLAAGATAVVLIVSV